MGDRRQPSPLRVAAPSITRLGLARQNRWGLGGGTPLLPVVIPQRCHREVLSIDFDDPVGSVGYVMVAQPSERVDRDMLQALQDLSGIPITVNDTDAPRLPSRLTVVPSPDPLNRLLDDVTPWRQRVRSGHGTCLQSGRPMASLRAPCRARSVLSEVGFRSAE